MDLISEAEAALMVWFLGGLESWVFTPEQANESICMTYLNSRPRQIEMAAALARYSPYEALTSSQVGGQGIYSNDDGTDRQAPLQ